MKVANFPPLAGSEWVNGDPNRATRIILNGLQGPIEVKGHTYTSVMPAQGAILKDDQIAAVLNYIRNSWGNSGNEEVTTEFVTGVRNATKGRPTPWTANEILEEFPFPVKPKPLFEELEATLSLIHI